MPLGEIKPRVLSAQESFRLERLSLMAYPDHRADIKHLNREDFITWFYMLEPRAALLLSCDPDFREIMVYQKGRNKLQELRDFVWRKLYGVS